MCKPTKNRIYCPECRRSKMLFESETKANTFIKFNKDNIENGDKLRSYFCVCCGGWHITHSTYNNKRDETVNNIIYNHLKSTEKTNVRKILNREKVNTILKDVRTHCIISRDELNIFLHNNYPDIPNNIIATVKQQYRIELKTKIGKTS
jgi:hypothetical protein